VSPDVCCKLAFEYAQVFLPPKIANDVFSADAQVGPMDYYFLRFGAVSGINYTEGTIGPPGGIPDV
jgi:hypothetical protein